MSSVNLRGRRAVQTPAEEDLEGAAILKALSAPNSSTPPPPPRPMQPPPPQLPAHILALCEGPPSAWQKPGESLPIVRMHFLLDAKNWGSSAVRQGQ